MPDRQREDPDQRRGGMKARIARLAWLLGGVLAATFLLVACTDVGPQDTLNPTGPVAQRELNLFVIVFWIAAAVFVVVEGAILFATLKFGAHKKADPVQVHGNKRVEIILTIAPAVVLAALAGPTVVAVVDLAKKPVGATVLNVEVIGHQWWWEYKYPDLNIVTANEMVIPTGRPVYTRITSVDVIHSFWVPKLAGKQDAVPGRHNPLTMKATEPGTYWGQCAEFCALSHANMRLRVIAKPESEFRTWVAGQQAEASSAALATEGAQVFKNFSSALGSCIGCHSIRGLPNAGGKVGPELTHFASRFTFAGSMFRRDADHVAKWLDNPPERKPGSIMPDLPLTEDMIAKLVEFLMRLS
jgi:cytochrome c oxidase subunit II